MGGARAAPRGGPGRAAVRARVQVRRPDGQPHLRGRAACDRGHARQRRHGRDDHRAGAHHPLPPGAHPVHRAHGGAGGVHHAPVGARGVQPHGGRAAQKRAQRRGGRAAQPRPGRDRRAPAGLLLLQRRLHRGQAVCRSARDAGVSRGERLPREPTRALLHERGGAACRHRRGGAHARRAGLPHRRHGGQGDVVCHARGAGRDGEVPALGGGVQVSRRGDDRRGRGRDVGGRAHGQADAAGAPEPGGAVRRDHPARHAQQL